MTQNNPWIYLAHAYTANPQASIKYAHVNANRFRKLGYNVESPNEQRYYTDQWLHKKRDNLNQVIYGQTPNPQKLKPEDKDNLFPLPNYIETEIDKIDKLKNHDFEHCRKDLDCGDIEDCEECDDCHPELHIKQDTGMVLALDVSVFKMPLSIGSVQFTKQHPSEYYLAWQNNDISPEQLLELWQSESCQRIVDDCMGSVLIIDAQRFLHLINQQYHFLMGLKGWDLIHKVIECYPEVKLF